MLSLSLSPLKNVPSYLYLLKKKALYSSSSFLFYGGTVTTLLLSVEPIKFKIGSLLPSLSLYQHPSLPYPQIFPLSAGISFSAPPSQQHTTLLRRSILEVDSPEVSDTFVPTSHKTVKEDFLSLPSPFSFSKVLPTLNVTPNNSINNSLENSLTETFTSPAATPLRTAEKIDSPLSLSQAFSQSAFREELVATSFTLDLPSITSRTVSLKEIVFFPPSPYSLQKSNADRDEPLPDSAFSSPEDKLLPLPFSETHKSLAELYSETLLHMKAKYPSLFARIASRRFTLAFYFLADLLKADSFIFQDFDVCKCEKFFALSLPAPLRREMEKDEVLKNFKNQFQNPDLLYSQKKVEAALDFLQSKRLIRSSETERIVEDELDPKYDKKYKYTILRRSSWDNEEMADF